MAFKASYVLCFVCQGLWLHRRQELLLSYWRSEVRPNGVEIARNFMCTPLLAILKDLAVFV